MLRYRPPPAAAIVRFGMQQREDCPRRAPAPTERFTERSGTSTMILTGLHRVVTGTMALPTVVPVKRASRTTFGPMIRAQHCLGCVEQAARDRLTLSMTSLKSGSTARPSSTTATCMMSACSIHQCETMTSLRIHGSATSRTRGFLSAPRPSPVKNGLQTIWVSSLATPKPMSLCPMRPITQ